MMWLLLVLTSTLLDAIRIFIDNYISDTFFKGRLAVSQKLFIAYSEIIFAIILIAIMGFSLGSTELYIIILAILAGTIYTIGGIPYYRALEIEESTNLGIFIQIAPILYLILGWMFLGESFSITQLIAIPIILLAPLIIVITSRKRSRKVKLRAVLYAFLYILFAVIGNLIFVRTNTIEGNHLGFLNEVALFYLGSGIANFIIVMSHRKWRARFKQVVKRNKSKVIIPVAISTIISFVKSILYRGGLIIAPSVAIASAASDSAEPIIIFFMGILLTIIWPRFGREKLSRKTVLVHLVATILVVIGILLLRL